MLLSCGSHTDWPLKIEPGQEDTRERPQNQAPVLRVSVIVWAGRGRNDLWLKKGEPDMVKTEQIQVNTRGNSQVIDITGQVREAVASSGLTAGVVTLFHVGSTGGLTTTEYEPGLVNHDLKAAFERIVPEDGAYEHEKTWDDDNGHSHVRASLLGPSLSVPFVEGRLTLGTWQQIILVDFDTRARARTVVCQMMGE